MVSKEEQANMMVVAIARVLRDGERVFHGLASPVPMVAILLAQRLHAPNLVYLNIAGSVNPQPRRLAVSTVDPVLLHGTTAYFSLAEVFDLAGRGELDTAFLSGVQIDRYGRINMSALGDYAKPKVRLPGGAGSAYLMGAARRVILWRTRHDVRTLVERVDFVTASGRVEWLFTPLCMMVRDEGELKVAGIYYYTSWDEVRSHTGWQLQCIEPVKVIPPPTPEEMAILSMVDPGGIRMTEF